MDISTLGNLNVSNVEMENIVISCILNNHPDIEEIFLQLSADDFFAFENRKIFEITNIFRKEGKIIDYLSVLDFIRSNKDFQFLNFENYLNQIDALYTYQQDIFQYLESIKNLSIKRKLFEFSKTLSSTDLDLFSTNEKLWDLEKKFLDITSNKKNKEIESMANILKEFQSKLDTMMNNSGKMTGTTSGYESLDKITNGFQPGDLIILAARPGIGKTALSLNFMVNAAKKFAEENMNKSPNEKDKVVLMFSMEMGCEQICQRILSIDSGVELNVNKHKVWTDVEKTALAASITELASYPIYVDDSSDLSIMDIQSKIKQMSNDKEIKLVVIDYLQLLKVSSKNTSLNRQQEVSEISRTLKKIARQFMIPIISIAQLSRKVEERKGDSKRPILSDLRESGSIEQDADMVCFLSYVEKEGDDNSHKIENGVMVEFIIAKNRNGPTTIVDFSFAKPISKYFDSKAFKN